MERFELVDFHFFFVTVVVGVDLGIFIGMGISLLLVVRHTSFPRVSLMAQSETGKWVDVSSDSKAKFLAGMIVVRIEEGLYFANMEQIKDMFKRIEIFGRQDAHPADERLHGDVPTGAIIIHVKNVQQIDASAMQTMCEMVNEYQKRKIYVCFVKLKTTLIKSFLRAGIINTVSGDRVFDSMQDAVRYVKVKILMQEEEVKEGEGNNAQQKETTLGATEQGGAGDAIPKDEKTTTSISTTPTPGGVDASLGVGTGVGVGVAPGGEPLILVEEDAAESSSSSSSDG